MASPILQSGDGHAETFWRALYWGITWPGLHAEYLDFAGEGEFEDLGGEAGGGGLEGRVDDIVGGSSD